MQIVDREQELMSTAGLQSLGGGAGLGRGGLDRQLQIVPSTLSSMLSCWLTLLLASATVKLHCDSASVYGASSVHHGTVCLFTPRCRAMTLYFIAC